MDPARIFLALGDDLYDDLAEGFAGNHPIKRIITLPQPMIVAIPQLETAPVVIDILPQPRQILDTVHPQRGIICPQQGLMGVDQQDAFTQAADDVTKAIEIDQRMRVGHADVVAATDRLQKQPISDHES
jgi:hypothetical protein